jgi:hypothetical protein
VKLSTKRSLWIVPGILSLAVILWIALKGGDDHGGHQAKEVPKRVRPARARLEKPPVVRDFDVIGILKKAGRGLPPEISEKTRNEEFSSWIAHDPKGFFSSVNAIEDLRARREVLNAGLIYLNAVNPAQVLDCLPGIPRQLVTSESLSEIGKELSYSGEDITSLMKAIDPGQRGQLIAAMSQTLVSDSKRSVGLGGFPDSYLLDDKQMAKEYLDALVRNGGGPKSLNQLRDWVGGANSAGAASVAASAYLDYGKAEPLDALNALGESEEFSSQPEVAEGLLRGISMRYPDRAAERAVLDLKDVRLGKFAVNQWLERDSTAASDWVVNNSQGEMRRSLLGLIADWVEARGDKTAAEAWRKEISDQ